MTDRLPLNLHHVLNGAAYVPLFADVYVEAVAPAQWGDKAACTANFQARQDVTAKLKAELVAQGADERAASVAAGSFMTFGFAPGYGLDGCLDVMLATRAAMALNGWIKARVEAWNAAQRAPNQEAA